MRKSKLKVYAVDAAIAFMAVQMTICISGTGCSNKITTEGTGTYVEANTEFSTQKEDTGIIKSEAPTVETGTLTQDEPQEYEQIIGSMDWDCDDGYLLAKIAMAEAENQDTEGKALVILVVLNRVWSEGFPNTIEDVIFQENQFSPVANGRWERVEPDEDCYRALEMVQMGWNESRNALYFESMSKSTWHQDNLVFLFQHGDHYFYTEHGRGAE